MYRIKTNGRKVSINWLLPVNFTPSIRLEEVLVYNDPPANRFDMLIQQVLETKPQL
jgi:hypothetical protein